MKPGEPIEERIKNCICGNGNVHTRECITHRRRIYVREHHKRVRIEKRAKHICTYGGCKEEIKPTIIYYQFCPKHKPSNKKKDEK